MAYLAGALIALSAANTITGAQRARKQGDAAVNADLQNASEAERQATDAVARGHENALNAAEYGDEVLAAQRAAIGASGVDVNSGSAFQLQQDTRRAASFDALMAENNAAREAAGYTFQAKQYRRAAIDDRRAARTAATSTLLGGAASVVGLEAQTGDLRWLGRKALTVGKRPRRVDTTDGFDGYE
jgi:hypothetical protein